MFWRKEKKQSPIQPGEIRVVIGGRLRLIKFGLGSTRVVCREHNLKLADLSTRFGVEDLFQEEIYGGLVHGLALQGETPDFNRAQVMDWIDELPQQTFQNIFDCWLMTSQHGETRYEKFVKVLIQQKATEETEKKN